MKFSIPLLLLFFALSANAELFRGPVSSALGGTGRAGMDGSEAAFLNPALIPLLKNYELDAYFRDGAVDPGQHRNTWGFGAGDNTTEVLFPGAIHYLRSRDVGRSATPVDGELWHLAIGHAFEHDLSVGISGYRLSSKVENDKEYVQWNYSLGLLWRITGDIGVAYVLDNLAKPGSEVPLGLREDLQQSLGFFAGLGPIARLRADLTRREVGNPEHRLVYAVGLENLIGEFAIFRVGFKRDDPRSQSYLTAGVAFNGPRLKIDYSFEKNLQGTSGALHGVDLRIPF